MVQISKRLKHIANYVEPFRNIIDVGTDHCLVPIYLLLHNKIDNAIATDINYGPILEAKKNVLNYNLENKIDIRLGNGLSTINNSDNCDVIIIAGMGGKLITEILNTGKHISHLNKRLILQPNVYEKNVRIWLKNNYYEIVEEKIIKEDNVFYEILVADKKNKIIKYSDLELKFGPILLKEKGPLFIEKWQNILKQKQDIYQKIPDYHINKKIFYNEIKDILTALLY